MVKEHVVSIVVSTIALVIASFIFLAHGELDKPLSPGTQEAKANEDVATKVKASSKYPVIGSLETRKGTIVIMSGPVGLLYDVRNKSGSVVSHELSEKELQARHPEIYNHIKGAVAGGIEWAGM